MLIPSRFPRQKKAVCVNTHASPIADISDSELQGGYSPKQVRLAAVHWGPDLAPPLRGGGAADVRQAGACGPSARAPLRDGAWEGSGPGRGFKRAAWAPWFCRSLPPAAVLPSENRLDCDLALFGSCLFSGLLHDALLQRAGRCWPLLLEYPETFEK